MSRLDDLVKRMATQRAVLNHAAELLKARALTGPVYELGLGSGRTYDHLKERFPTSEIFTFDWAMEATKGCVPDRRHFFKGEIRKTFPKFVEGRESTAALTHLDIGTHDLEYDGRVYSALLPYVVQSLRPGGLIASDRALVHGGLESLDMSALIVEDWDYFLYRKA